MHFPGELVPVKEWHLFLQDRLMRQRFQDESFPPQRHNNWDTMFYGGLLFPHIRLLILSSCFLQGTVLTVMMCVFVENHFQGVACDATHGAQNAGSASPLLCDSRTSSTFLSQCPHVLTWGCYLCPSLSGILSGRREGRLRLGHEGPPRGWHALPGESPFGWETWPWLSSHLDSLF